jgi:hypothetical protein
VDIRLVSIRLLLPAGPGGRRVAQPNRSDTPFDPAEPSENKGFIGDDRFCAPISIAHGTRWVRAARGKSAQVRITSGFAAGPHRLIHKRLQLSRPGFKGLQLKPRNPNAGRASNAGKGAVALHVAHKRTAPAVPFARPIWSRPGEGDSGTPQIRRGAPNRVCARLSPSWRTNAD